MDTFHLLITLGFFRIELNSLINNSGLASNRHEIISFDILSKLGALPRRSIYASCSISSLVISKSRGPISQVFGGSGLSSVFAFWSTFLK